MSYKQMLIYLKQYNGKNGEDGNVSPVKDEQ